MKKGLGRGFGSLIPTNLIDETFDPTAQQDVKVSHLRDIAIDQVVPDPDQPRRFFDENALNELTESVREHGVVQPIVVTPKGDKYLIVAGGGRWGGWARHRRGAMHLIFLARVRASAVFRFLPSPLHHTTVRNYETVTCG